MHFLRVEWNLFINWNWISNLDSELCEHSDCREVTKDSQNLEIRSETKNKKLLVDMSELNANLIDAKELQNSVIGKL